MQNAIAEASTARLHRCCNTGVKRTPSRSPGLGRATRLGRLIPLSLGTSVLLRDSLARTRPITTQAVEPAQAWGGCQRQLVAPRPFAGTMQRTGSYIMVNPRQRVWSWR